MANMWKELGHLVVPGLKKLGIMEDAGGGVAKGFTQNPAGGKILVSGKTGEDIGEDAIKAAKEAAEQAEARAAAETARAEAHAQEMTNVAREAVEALAAHRNAIVAPEAIIKPTGKLGKRGLLDNISDGMGKLNRQVMGGERVPLIEMQRDFAEVLRGQGKLISKHTIGKDLTDPVQIEKRIQAGSRVSEAEYKTLAEAQLHKQVAEAAGRQHGATAMPTGGGASAAGGAGGGAAMPPMSAGGYPAGAVPPGMNFKDAAKLNFMSSFFRNHPRLATALGGTLFGVPLLGAGTLGWEVATTGGPGQKKPGELTTLGTLYYGLDLNGDPKDGTLFGNAYENIMMLRHGADGYADKVKRDAAAQIPIPKSRELAYRTYVGAAIDASQVSQDSLNQEAENERRRVADVNASITAASLTGSVSVARAAQYLTGYKDENDGAVKKLTAELSKHARGGQVDAKSLVEAFRGKETEQVLVSTFKDKPEMVDEVYTRAETLRRTLTPTTAPR